MENLGPPIAYLAMKEGGTVYDRDGGRVGVVTRILADEPVDIFHGLIVQTRPLPGRHVFVDADQIAELHERGVLLSVGRDELHELGSGSRSRTTGGPLDDQLQARLRRAWDRLRGHR